ncbi:MAG: hypothetical protein ACNS62_13720 [Candidatus Cyclobacteriaceae bacterium M3_2C_046]
MNKQIRKYLHKRFFICLLFFVFLQNLTRAEPAQDSLQISKRSGHGTVLKISPLNMIDFFHALPMALEYELNDHTNLQHELGFVIPRFGPQAEDDFKNMYGIRSKHEIRHYTKETYPGNFKYLALEFLFNYIWYNTETVQGVNVSGAPGFDYFQFRNNRMHRWVHGFHLKFGSQKLHSDFFITDFYFGLGLRLINISTAREFDQDTFAENDGLWENLPVNDTGINVFPSATLGIKFGLKLNK